MHRLRQFFFLAACYLPAVFSCSPEGSGPPPPPETVRVIEGPVESADYHTLRAGLINSRSVFETQKRGRVAFLGGSITYNPGWRDSVTAYLQERFPETEFEFVAAGIPSMGTTPGAFRLQRDVLGEGPVDLLFEEAAVNDRTNGRTDEEQLRAMEGIVRQVRGANPAADIVLLHFVDPDKMNDYRAGRTPAEIANHERVAEHYGLPSVNLAAEVTDRIDAGEFNWEEDFVDLHPSPFGQGVYARSIMAFLEAAWPEDQGLKATEARPLPEKLDPFCYDRGRLYEPRRVDRQEGWELMENWHPLDTAQTRANYIGVPMMVSTTPGPLLRFYFRGTAAGIAVAAGPDAGIIEYRIDRQPWQRQDLYTQWSSWLHLPWYYTLAADLPDERHTLELRLSNDKNPESLGTACRIRYFFVNGEELDSPFQ